MIEERTDSEWTNAIIDIAIYALVMTVGLIAIAMIGLPRMQALFDEIPPTYSRDFAVYEEFFRTLSTITLPGLIVLMVILGLVSTVTAVIQNALIHVAASRMLKGSGTLPAMLGKIVPFQSVILLISVALLIVMLLLMPAGNASARAFNSAASLWLPLLLALIVVSIGSIFWMSRLLGEAYNFGTGNGCAALVIGSVLYSIASYACSCFLPVVMSAFFGRGFPT
jgi:hypothetical protein